MNAIENLEKSGYSVKFTHGRAFMLPAMGIFFGTRGEHPALPPLPTGGFTICTILRDGKRVVSAKAICSRKDNFCKKIGRDIALGRAVADLTGKTAHRVLAREIESA